MTYSPHGLGIDVLGTTETSKFVSTDSSGHVITADNFKYKFGTGADASIYFDAAKLVICDETIDVQIGNSSNTVTIAGNLTVGGTTTTINSTTLTVDDKLIELAHSPSGSEGNDAAVDGGGIILKSSQGDKSITWVDSTDLWTFNQGLGVTGTGTFSGILKTDDTTDATTKTDGSLQTDGGLSVAKAIYNGTAATLAADSGIVTIGSTTAATFSAAGLLNVNNATEATSTTDGSLQTDGGLSVVKDIVGGDDLILLTDSAVIHFGEHKEVTLTHVHDSGLTLKHTATADDKPITLTLATGETDMAADDVIGVINFQAPDEGEGTDAILVAAGIAAVSEGDFSASSNATKLSFRTASSEAASEKMSLSSGGNLTVSGDVTVNGGDITVAGATPKITIGDADAEDAMLAFDGNAQDFHIALDDTADDLVIGVGTTAGTTTAIAINENAQVSIVDLFAANVAGSFGTFSDGDATPSVATGNLWKHHASTQTITMFDDGVAGQTIHVISTAAITYDVTSTNLKGGSTDIVTASGDITSWFFDGTNWYLVQFMDVSADMSSVGGGGVASTVTVTDNDATAENNLITFVADAATSTGSHGLEMDGELYYNPSTNRITATDVEAKGVFVNSIEITSSAGDITKGFTGVTTSTTNRQMDLPAAASTNVGAMYTIKKLDSASGQVQVTRAGDDTIDGGTSVVLYHKDESVTVICGAADTWYIM